MATCTNGSQALACCREWKPDLLFTDIRMPVMDGMELVSQLKKEGHGSVHRDFKCLR
ncbi:response regulator [Blautia argi]|uniref:response regulator n=1 Tax=Blautia argi TaxID=1912897 RepID=UPI001A9A35BF